MASLYKTMGRLAGRAMRNQTVNAAVSKASQTLNREMAIADIRLKRRLLEKKRMHHIELLGKTVYRLTKNGHNPVTDSHILIITRVLSEIDIEIQAVNEELARRTETASTRKNSGSGQS